MRAARAAAPRVVLAAQVLVVVHAEGVVLAASRVVIIAHFQNCDVEENSQNKNTSTLGVTAAFYR